MKKILRFIALLLLMSAYTFVSCTDTDDGKYVEPITIYEKVKGSWQLIDIKQIDETAKVLGLSPTEISLYSQFSFDNFTITLNTDEAYQPTSYEVISDAPELFPHKGYWELDLLFPQANGTTPMVNLYSDVAKTNLIGQLKLVTVPGASPTMELKLTRNSGGVAFISYNYEFTKK